MEPSFLISALDGGECSASRSCRFTPWERVPGTHWIGKFGGPQHWSERCGEKKIILHGRESNPAAQLVVRRYID
jgi:hypothetical protein